VRYSSGATPTDYGFTGQMDYTGSFGLLYFNARFYDPSLSRFISADTIVPPGVQGLDRYGYVNNSPVNFTDPTGHCPEEDDECRNRLAKTLPSTGGNGDGGDGYKPNLCSSRVCDPNAVTIYNNIKNCRGPLGTGNCGSPFPSQYVPPATRESGYCGGGPNIITNGFDCAANITQDAALAVDIPFAGAELILAGIGCLGGIKGCLAGAKLGQILFQGLGANNVEMGLSGTSAVFSTFADIADGNSPGENFILGQSTVTAFTTAGVGSISKDPFVDFIIDGYGAGYNHDFFNGVYSFVTSDPVIKP